MITRIVGMKVEADLLPLNGIKPIFATTLSKKTLNKITITIYDYYRYV